MKIRLYIADDHAVVRDGLRALLEDQQGIEVVGDAGNGRQAVKQVCELHPDIVLMDISMPELNGIDATAQILVAYPDIRIIILSMLGTPEHVSRALEAGARGYLLKESAGREVVEAVLSVNAGKIYLSQPITETLVHDYLDLRERTHKMGPLGDLSQRERQILEMVVAGKTSSEIGKELNLSRKTIESYRSRLMQKLGVEDLPALIRFAVQAGMMD